MEKTHSHPLGQRPPHKLHLTACQEFVVGLIPGTKFLSTKNLTTKINKPPPADRKKIDLLDNFFGVISVGSLGKEN